MSVARIPFTSAEESVLRQLAGWMLFIAIVHFVGGALLLIFGCLFAIGGSMMAAATMGSFAKEAAGLGAVLGILGLVIGVVGAIILVLQGVLLTQARGSFMQVVLSDHADQEHLAAGFGKLKLFFLIEAILAVLGLLGSGGRLVSVVVGMVA